MKILLSNIKEIDLQRTPSHNMSWVRKINDGICELNQLVDQYNAEDSQVLSIAILESIELEMQRIDDELPDSVVADIDQYRHIFYNLFITEVRQRKRELHGRVMPVGVVTSQLYIANLLQDMQPEKLSSLLSILIHGDKACLSDLESLYETTHPESLTFKSFLKHHTISYLAGKNSKNFLIERKDTNDRWVLKVENRLNTTKSFERTLRKRLTSGNAQDDFLVRNIVERRATIELNGTCIVRTIILMDYCSAKSLQDLSSLCRNDSERIDLAIDIGLAQLMLAKRTLAVRAVNTDYKADNLFFIKSENSIQLRVMVADCKGFLGCDDSGYVVAPWDGRAIMSLQLSAPEVGFDLNQIRIKASPVLVYTVAKNMYEVLVSGFPQAIQCSRKTVGFNSGFFGADIFKSDKGELLADMMLHLSVENPEARMSLDDAIIKLNGLKFGPSYTRVLEMIRGFNLYDEVPLRLLDDYMYALHIDSNSAYRSNTDLSSGQRTLFGYLYKLKQLLDLKFGEEDRMMKQFVQQAVINLLTQVEFKQTLMHIDEVLSVQLDSTVQNIQQEIKKLRGKNYLNYFSPESRVDKARMIERAMRELPLLERNSIFEDEGSTVLKQSVREALLKRTVTPLSWFNDVSQEYVNSSKELGDAEVPLYPGF